MIDIDKLKTKLNAWIQYILKKIESFNLVWVDERMLVSFSTKLSVYIL